MKFIHGVTATLAAQFVGLIGLVVVAFVADDISERKKKAKSEGEAAGYKRGLADAERRTQQAAIERSFIAPGPITFDRITGTHVHDDNDGPVLEHTHTLGGRVARTPNDVTKEALEEALLAEIDDRAAGNPDDPRAVENEWRERQGLQPWPPPGSFVEPPTPPDFTR